MTAPTAVELSEPNRQSPLAAIFLVIRAVRSIGILQIVFGAGFLLSRSPSIIVLALGVVLLGIVAVGIGLLSWWRYTFQIVGGELQVTKGIVAQNNLSVPLDRVQSVSIEQKFLHRIVKLVQVSLDTAGTDTAEFTIDAVSQDVALALQRAAADYRPRDSAVSSTTDGVLLEGGEVDGVSSTPPAPDRVLIKHDVARIIKVALTQMPFTGLAVLAPLFAFGGDIADRIPFDVPDIDVGVGRWLLWFVPVAILAVVAVSVVLNVIRTLLADWDLTITRTAAGLRRDAGLLSKTSVASSLPRVQAFEASQGVLQRQIGLHHVTLRNIGDADVQVPGCDGDQVALLRDLAFVDGDGVHVLDRRVSRLEVFKQTRNTAIVMIALAIGLYFLISWWSLLLLLPVPFTWATTKRRVRLRRWGLDTDAIADHRELWGWQRKEILMRKANGVKVSQSLFERKRGLASVQVQLAGGLLASGSFTIGMIPLEQAEAVRDRVLYVVETDQRAYM